MRNDDMKMKKVYKRGVSILGAFVLIFGIGFEEQAWAREGLIGTVNLSLVFENYKKKKKYDDELKEIVEKKRAERTAMINEIDKLRDELDLLREDKKAAKQGEIDEKVKQLQSFDREFRDDLRVRQDAMMREIFKDIDKVVKEFGDKEGYDYIFNDRVLLYKSEARDLSQRILEHLNASN